MNESIPGVGKLQPGDHIWSVKPFDLARHTEINYIDNYRCRENQFWRCIVIFHLAIVVSISNVDKTKIVKISSGTILGHIVIRIISLDVYRDTYRITRLLPIQNPIDNPY